MAEWSRLSSDCALFLAKAWRHGAAERQTDAMDRDTCAVTHLLHLQCCHMYVHCWNSVDRKKTCNYLHDYFTVATVPLQIFCTAISETMSHIPRVSLSWLRCHTRSLRTRVVTTSWLGLEPLRESTDAFYDVTLGRNGVAETVWLLYISF